MDKPNVSAFNTTVGTSAVLVDPGTTYRSNSVATLLAPSTNTATIYLGASGVTSGTGFALAAGQSMQVPEGGISSLYAISTAASQVLQVIKFF